MASRERIGALLAVVLAVVALVGGCTRAVDGAPDDGPEAGSVGTSSPTTTPPATTSPSVPAGNALPPFDPPADLGANCTYPASTDPAAKPATSPRSGPVPTEPALVSVSMVTNVGPIGLQLDNAKAPCTVNNFASLAQQGYYDDTTCHRLTNASTLSVLQCGDPAGDGSGGPGYEFGDEYPVNQYLPGDPAGEEPVVYPRGTLAMANAGPNTNGSQFFLVYQDSVLPPKYTVFGTIDQTGLETLDKIAAGGVVDGGEDGSPATDVTIMSVRLD